MADFSVVRLDKETFTDLVLIELAPATQLASSPPGLLTLEFKKPFQKSVIYDFIWVSSVLYVDELLSNRITFPYAYTGRHAAGLYECVGSSYLARIQNDLDVSGGTFQDHKHFIYWDTEFSWHITCKDIASRVLE